MRLSKELKARKTASDKEFDSNKLVKEATKLLNEGHDEDRKILEHIGLDHHIQASEIIRDEKTIVEVLQEKFGTEAFLGKDIKELCGKYNLRCLRVDKYVGKIPPTLARKVKEFVDLSDDKEVVLSRQNLFIIAPIELFSIGKTEKAPIIRNVDPILCYCTTAEEHRNERYTHAGEDDVFVPIMEWGNDMTIFRILSKYFSMNQRSSLVYVEREITDAPSISNLSKLVIFTIIAFIGALCMRWGMNVSIATDADSQTAMGFTMVCVILLGLFYSWAMHEGLKNLKNAWNKHSD